MNLIYANQFFILLGAVGALALGVAALAFALADARRKLRILFGAGKTNDDLDRNLAGRIANAEKHLAELAPRLEAAEAIAKLSIHKVGFMRFNPFQDTGGDQSFTLVLLDSEASGVVLSSLYTREGVRVYAKNVVRGTSRHPLTEEERRVVEEAMGKGIMK